jgi:AraC-like DNA-binding protein
VLNLASIGLEEVAVLGRHEYSYAHPGLTTHTHPGAVEICYLERGYQTYRVSGREYHLAGGDIFVIPPGEPHDTDGQAEDRGILYWLNVNVPEGGKSLLMLPPGESAAMIATLSQLPQRQFTGRPVLKQMLNQVFTLSQQPTSPLVRIAVSTELVRCILEVINCAYRQESLYHSAPITKIAERIKSHPGKEYALSNLAKEAGLSISRFNNNFKLQLGVPPREFILRCKVGAAKKLLSEQCRSVTDTAMELGFSSSQYFATVFKRFTQQTPIEYRSQGPAVARRQNANHDPSRTR